MPITAYTDIITLERARNYLRVDDTLTADDDEIKSMIKAAFLFMERYTDHIFMPKPFTQYSNGYIGGCAVVTVYKYPINTTTPEDVKIFKKRNLSTTFEVVEVTYEAGYTEVEQIPDDLIQSALQIIKVWYFESEKQVNETLIPVSVRQVLDTYRRFV
jgi:hypothetical protein